MRASTKRRLRSLRRITRAWLLVVLAAVTSSWSLAFVAPCSAHEKTESVEAPDAPCCPSHKNRAADEPQPNDENDCSCPLECGPCCGGLPPSLVMTVPAPAPVLLPELTLLTFSATADNPADGAPHDILHVPRS